MSQYKIINPYNNDVLAEVEYTSKEDTLKKIALLKSGQKTLKNLAAFERANILHKLCDIMTSKKEEFAIAISKEMGKTMTDAIIEMDRAITTIFCSAEECRRINGEVLNTDAYPPKRNKKGMTEYFPLGTILCITPFNFPINLAVHKIGPAFAAGNSILFKPGPQNYLTGKKLVDACHEAGFPKNCIELVNPDIPVMSEIVSHPDINCISFTGGVVAAKAIAKNAGIKKLLLELGGNDPLIVMPDGDVELAVKTTINQRFGASGQRCTACKRFFIHEKVYEQFKNLLVAEAKKLKVGNPLEKDTFVGPVVHKGAADTIMNRIEEAVKSGATVLLGNKRDGNIIYPTILENVPDHCELVKDETFGPVVPLKKFSNIDDVITFINSGSFGLQSGIFTNDLSIMKKVFSELEVGAVAVNDGPGFRVEHFPFGGVKDSGLGREGVRYAIMEMSNIKTLIF